MIKTGKINIHKDRKIEKRIEIKKKLEREIEEILGKQITVNSYNKDGSYQAERKSIFRKDRRK